MTPKRAEALKEIAAVPGKSGNFWRSLGIAAQTLIAAEIDGLLEGRVVREGDDSALLRRWFITETGRAALAKESEPLAERKPT